MAAAAAVADGEKSAAFRWVDAARYAVAAVVTVLIITVIVKAIEVVLRPEPLQIWVVGGSISAWRPPPPPPSPEMVVVKLRLDLWAQNPSDRVRMYFLNITGYLFDNTTSAAASLDPESDSMMIIPVKDIVVAQLDAVESSLQLMATNGSMAPEKSFGVLYNGGSISDVTLRLDGNLITEVTSEVNKTRPASYYCEQLVVGGDPDDDGDGSAKQDNQKVICKQRE